MRLRCVYVAGMTVEDMAWRLHAQQAQPLSLPPTLTLATHLWYLEVVPIVLLSPDACPPPPLGAPLLPPDLDTERTERVDKAERLGPDRVGPAASSSPPLSPLGVETNTACSPCRQCVGFAGVGVVLRGVCGQEGAARVAGAATDGSGRSTVDAVELGKQQPDVSHITHGALTVATWPDTQPAQKPQAQQHRRRLHPAGLESALPPCPPPYPIKASLPSRISGPPPCGGSA